MEAGGREAATLTLNSSLSPASATSAPTRHVMSGAGRAPATAHRSTASAPSETTTAAQLSAATVAPATAQLRLTCVGAVTRSSCRAAWRGRPRSVLAASQVTTLSARARDTEARRRLLVVTPASSLDTLHSVDKSGNIANICKYYSCCVIILVNVGQSFK